eukprot:scaffold36418_cov191-Amphora_coffeaeformis.AAC.6
MFEEVQDMVVNYSIKRSLLNTPHREYIQDAAIHREPTCAPLVMCSSTNTNYEPESKDPGQTPSVLLYAGVISIDLHMAPTKAANANARFERLKGLHG